MASWMTLFDFGIVHPLAFPACRGGEGPILETIELLAADETIGAVEIAPILDPAVRRRAGDLIAAAAMQVVYLPVLPIIFQDFGVGSADPAGRRAAQDRLQPLLDEAIALGAPLAMIAAPRDPDPGERPAMTDRFAADVRALCDYADARCGARRLFITLENFDRDVEKKRLIGPTAEAAAFAEMVGRENFGLTVDLSHLPLLRESADQALGAAAPYLIHAHIGNCVVDNPACPFYGDFHPRFGHPEGRNDEPQVVEYLRELDAVDFWGEARRRLGSTPILSMEIKPTPTEEEPSAVVIGNGKRVFLRAWAKAGIRTGAPGA